MAGPQSNAALSIADVLQFIAPGVQTPDWPPDVFAVAAFLLQKGNAYAEAVHAWAPSTGPGPHGPHAWTGMITRIGGEWRVRAVAGQGAPAEVQAWWTQLQTAARAGTLMQDICSDIPLCHALLQLCASADEASAGVGGPTGIEDESDDGPVGILHFAGHGKFNFELATASFLKLEDDNLTAAEVNRQEVTLGERCRPLVIFNACEVGATSAVLGAVGGWAETLIGRQFGAFVAPLWSVHDEEVVVVGTSLVERIVQQHQPLGAALQEIRAAEGNRSASVFSYLLYGDVLARLGTRHWERSRRHLGIRVFPPRPGEARFGRLRG